MTIATEHALEICALKAKAKRLLRRIDARYDGLDCGKSLAHTIRPDIPIMERQFAEVMERLRTIDPTAPKGE
jgi:hypothetical protein